MERWKVVGSTVRQFDSSTSREMILCETLQNLSASLRNSYIAESREDSQRLAKL